jgi:hypothetical protein
LKGKAGYNEGREEKKKEKKKREKQKDGVVYGVVPYLLLTGPLVMWGIEMCVIPGSCSSLGQHTFLVNLGEVPHPVKELEESNS